ncbi:DinB family protein [Paenibacillus sp. FSL M7-1455]|uniref:DinB family protein n=1 Tax=Paenibacillus sp. FSL M7-1455 TaxID=2975316 RepID=UPI0030FACA48
MNLIQDEQLEKELEFNGYIGTGRLWLETAKDHEIHHKGQLFTYARMIGVEKLPFMMKQPPKKQ